MIITLITIQIQVAYNNMKLKMAYTFWLDLNARSRFSALNRGQCNTTNTHVAAACGHALVVSIPHIIDAQYYIEKDTCSYFSSERIISIGEHWLPLS